MAQIATSSRIYGAMDKYDAIAQQGDSDELAFYFYTGEFGWSAYAETYDLAGDSLGNQWIHSADSTFDSIGLDSDYSLHMEDSSITSETDTTSVYKMVITDLDDLEDTGDNYWQPYLQLAANIAADEALDSVDEDEDGIDDNTTSTTPDYEVSGEDQDISDLTVLDYITNVQGVDSYQDWADAFSETTDGDSVSIGLDQTLNVAQYIRTIEGTASYQAFAALHTDVSKPYMVFKHYLEMKHLPFKGYPTQIVALDPNDYGVPVPDNLWPCDGSEITNVNAVPQLYGKNAPDYSGCVLASPDDDNEVDSTAGKASRYLSQKNLPTLEGSVTTTYTPEGTISITDPGHKHSFTYRQLYKVTRNSSDIDDNSATDGYAGEDVTTSSGNAIETGANDRYYFYWKGYSKNTGSKTTGISATFSGTEATIEGTTLINEDIGDDLTALDIRQPTAYKQFYIVIY